MSFSPACHSFLSTQRSTINDETLRGVTFRKSDVVTLGNLNNVNKLTDKILTVDFTTKVGYYLPATP